MWRTHLVSVGTEERVKELGRTSVNETSIHVFIRGHHGGGFLTLQQDRPVMEYRLAFETLAAPIGDVSNAILEGHFINALSLNIKAEILVLKPRTDHGTSPMN